MRVNIEICIPRRNLRAQKTRTRAKSNNTNGNDLVKKIEKSANTRLERSRMTCCLLRLPMRGWFA
jgi:hypothetical protein